MRIFNAKFSTEWQLPNPTLQIKFTVAFLDTVYSYCEAQIHKAGGIKEHAFSNGLWQNGENGPPETLLV